MALGALVLSRMKAIVSRLESIEEMAGMDVLCSDKTGTLTQNHLTLGEPVRFAAESDDSLILAAALASKDEDQDAIDMAMLRGVRDSAAMERLRQERFVPFDPVHKRTEATISDEAGNRFYVTKGAPQVIAGLCQLSEELSQRVSGVVDDLAAKGYRTLGVARSDDGVRWDLLGILPLFDPPRDDAAETLAQAGRHGIRVKMVTGDNEAIAVQIAEKLGLGSNVLPAECLSLGADSGPETATREQVQQADGFAQVFPEHKYGIVKALQTSGHLVGMTGDGVNDAPALKQADVGIAVSGATDAARSAADLVLTAPGLGVIISAVEEARRIFARMNAYAIYRITETIRIMIFMVLTMILYDFYPITAVMIILLALLNDLPIMAIASDNTWLDPRPARWDMKRVLTVASVLGGIGVLETFLLLVITESWLGLPQTVLQSVLFLKLVVAGHLTLLVARTRGSFWARPYPSAILLGAILATQATGVLIVGLGFFMTAIPWSYVALIWAYCLVWLFIEDAAKRLIYAHLDATGPRHRRFLEAARRSLFEHRRDSGAGR
jgi:H+-transporting ATPase